MRFLVYLNTLVYNSRSGEVRHPNPGEESVSTGQHSLPLGGMGPEGHPEECKLKGRDIVSHLLPETNLEEIHLILSHKEDQEAGLMWETTVL